MGHSVAAWELNYILAIHVHVSSVQCLLDVSGEP